MITLFILAIIFIFTIEGIPLIKKGLWRELGVFCFLLGIAVSIGIAKGLGVPTPIEWLQQLLGPIGMAILK